RFNKSVDINSRFFFHSTFPYFPDAEFDRRLQWFDSSSIEVGDLLREFFPAASFREQLAPGRF
ncbi:MAG TPA: hypothetical protein PLR50_04430, partial [Candidatus Rifleibacterium sp.]|nr:hypothetical protein [Candidatus Rifleibacterium sp.]